MPFVISSKTGFIYCGKAVMNRMMLGGSWTAICFSCHCGGQMPRQCSCPCHDLMRCHHSFEPIWWYNLQEWGKMSAFVFCSTHHFAEVNQGCQRFNQGCQCCVAHPIEKVLAQSMERKTNLAPWRKLVIANRRNTSPLFKLPLAGVTKNHSFYVFFLGCHWMGFAFRCSSLFHNILVLKLLPQKKAIFNKKFDKVENKGFCLKKTIGLK